MAQILLVELAFQQPWYLLRFSELYVHMRFQVSNMIPKDAYGDDASVADVSPSPHASLSML